MQYLKKHYIKLVIFIVTIIVLVNPKYSGYSLDAYIFNFYWNIIHKTNIETKYFVIDLARFNWILIKEKDDELFFGGVTVFINKDDEDRVLPTLIFDNFYEGMLDAWEKMCGISFTKSTKIINGWDAEVYDCIDVKNPDIPSQMIVYKDEAFYIYTYIDAFKPQYDKFFEGVKLREQ
ncbi:MAG: hypothetical protein LBL65_04275 [Campylobacteraceae bacterium]|jgi:hypothetical protein|nr:hypothetical protein [Campylobacteraceae bacterium]